MFLRVPLGGVLLGGALLAALAGCSSSTDDYCTALADQQPALTRLAESADRPGSDVLGDSLAIFEDLRDQAPGDIRDEWDTYVFAWRGLADAFEQAGVDPADYRPDASGPGVTEADRRQIANAADELRSPRVVEAGQGIEQHARDVCEIDLGL